jgi:hypothetical protein
MNIPSKEDFREQAALRRAAIESSGGQARLAAALERFRERLRVSGAVRAKRLGAGDLTEARAEFREQARERRST